MRIILQHGWGCDSRLWSGWIDALQQQFPGSSVRASERGYFGLDPVPAKSLSEINNRPMVLICHSFGLHMVSASVLRQCHALVLISSFGTFHGGNEKEQKLSRTRVRRMLAKLQTEPMLVVKDFHEACGFDESLGVPPGANQAGDGVALDMQLLADDLQLLNRCTFDVELLRTIPQVQILHGEQDLIVPLERASELNNSLTNSFLSVLESAQHSLPVAYTDWCVQQISDCFAPAPVWVSKGQ